MKTIIEPFRIKMTEPIRITTRQERMDALKKAFDYLLEVIASVWEIRHRIKGYRIVHQPDFLRHFSARFEPMA